MTNRKSHIRFRVSIGAKINDLRWPWRAITHCVSKHVRLSEPTTKIWMKIDYTVSDDDVANDFRFWQYKVCADIHRGSQDLCKFSWFYAYARILRIHVPHAFSLRSSTVLFTRVIIQEFVYNSGNIKKCKIESTQRVQTSAKINKKLACYRKHYVCFSIVCWFMERYQVFLVVVL